MWLQNMLEVGARIWARAISVLLFGAFAMASQREARSTQGRPAARLGDGDEWGIEAARRWTSVAHVEQNIRREQVEVKRAEFAAANAGYKWVFDRPGVGPDWIEYCWAEALREIEEVALRDAGMWRFADGYLWHVCTVCGTSAACTHKLDDACDEARARFGFEG